MSDELHKLPPQNLEAETSVLGSILIDAEAISKIADLLSSDDFYKHSHTQIFEVMLELYSEREPIDLLSLTNRLEEKQILDKIGGRSYLAELTNSVVTSSNILSYAQIVQKKAALRKLINAAQEITALGYSEEEKVDSLLDEAEQKIFQISQKHLKQNFIPVRSILDETFERIDEMHREGGKIRGLPTTYYDLDAKLAGLQKSDLVILAARPSMGKTTLALDIARQIGKNKHPVGIFSLEMSKEQLVDRMLCAEAGVDLWRMRTGKLSDREEDDDFPRIGHAMSVLSEAPIFIDDSATANIMELRTKARRLKAEHGLELIIIDYLQLMEGRSKSSENRVQEVSEISRSLKALARELNVPVLALSQLSRAVESERPPIPKLSHLRESGSIEQDADVVLFIYREYMYKREDTDPDRRNIAEIFIAKHRNGPTGKVELIFNEEKVRFENKARGDTPQPEY
jgi:replicative DNA helicase